MKKSVLVCDDDSSLLRLLADILDSAGFSVETARDGIEALSKAIKSQPNYYDLILVDHLMPGLDGLGLIKELRECGIPSKIIVLSGNLDDELEAAFKQMDLAKVLAKPSGITEVAECATALFSDSPCG